MPSNCFRLEPLLNRIKERRSAILCPMIDVIDDKTLYYSQNGGEAVGGFTWSLHFTWHQTFDRELKRRAIEKGSDYIRLVERTSKMVPQMVMLYLFYPELLG